jgi:uncharacterized membrane protein YkvA (DUF1232 family)
MLAWQRRIQALRAQVGALYLALGDPRVPRLSKVIIVAVVAYALSPIDLIPDVIPVLGLLDDLIILPLGLYLAIRLMPPVVWSDCQARAARDKPQLPHSRGAAALIVTLWICSALGLGYYGYRVLS